MTQYLFKNAWKRTAAACFDAAGRVCLAPFRSRKKPLDLASVRRILVIRLDHIGDMVMARPAIRALHKKFPSALIDILVTEDIAPLFENSREIHTVIAAKHGWFNRKATFIQKWAEFWRLVGILKRGGRRHCEEPATASMAGDVAIKDEIASPQSLLSQKSTGARNDKPYDIGIDLRGDLRNILLMGLAGIKHTIGYGITGGGFLLSEEIPHDVTQHQVRLNLNLLSPFRVAQDNKLLPFEYSPERAQNFWTKIEVLPLTTLLPRVAIHMESGYPSKRWPLENFRTLIQKIDREEIAQIILIGTETEKRDTPGFKPKEPHAADLGHPRKDREPDQEGSTPDRLDGALPTCGNDLLLETLNSERLIDLRGKTELRDLPVLLDVCDAFIGNDSGPAHIAAAQGLEIVLIASGTNDIRFWYPWTERLSLLQHEVPCSPCELEICPVEGHPCVEEITVDQAYDALLSVLVRLQKRP